MNTKLLLLSFAGLLSLNQMGSSALQARTTTRLDQGWRFPATSVGWYRYTFDVPQEMLGQHVELQFDGIFRDAIVWVNGFILWSDGNEEWGLENNQQGKRVAASMREYTHRLDPTRLVCMANAGSRCLSSHLCDRKYRSTFFFAPYCSLMS